MRPLHFLVKSVRKPWLEDSMGMVLSPVMAAELSSEGSFSGRACHHANLHRKLIENPAFIADFRHVFGNFSKRLPFALFVCF